MRHSTQIILAAFLTTALLAGCSSGDSGGGDAADSDIVDVTLASESNTPTSTTTNQTTTTSITTTTSAPSTTNPPETTTTTIPIKASRTAWANLTGNAAYATSQPWSSDGVIHAVAHSSDTGLSPSARTGFVLHTFDGTQWTGSVDIGGTDCNSMPQSCTIDLIGEATQRPVLYMSWCCPMNHPAWSGPIAAAFQVNDGRVLPAVDGKEYFFAFGPDSDSWAEDTCTTYWLSGTPDEQCVEWLTTEYTVRPDGRIDTADSARTEEAAFTVCMEHVMDQGCQLETIIKYDSRCEIDPVWTLAFSLEKCEYGGWVLMAELRLVELGYSVIADGYYDPGEVPTIVAFQNQNGLDADGYIGRGTWSAIFPDLVCTAVQYCDDINDDGVFGPGDIFPH